MKARLIGFVFLGLFFSTSVLAQKPFTQSLGLHVSASSYTGRSAWDIPKNNIVYGPGLSYSIQYKRLRTEAVLHQLRRKNSNTTSHFSDCGNGPVSYPTSFNYTGIKYGIELGLTLNNLESRLQTELIGGIAEERSYEYFQSLDMESSSKVYESRDVLNSVYFGLRAGFWFNKTISSFASLSYSPLSVLRYSENLSYLSKTNQGTEQNLLKKDIQFRFGLNFRL